MTTIRSRPDNVSTRHSPPDNVLVEGNRSTVPPYPSSFLIHHRAIPWHTLATYQWGALPSSRGDVFAAIFSLLRIQSPTRQRSRGRSSCGRHSIHRANSETGPWTHRGRGETLLVDKKYAVASGECRMGVKLSCTIQLLLTVQLVLPLLARPGSSSFVFLHVCTSPSPPLALRYGGAGRNSHHVSMYMKSHHDSPCTCPRPRLQFV